MRKFFLQPRKCVGFIPLSTGVGLTTVPSLLLCLLPAESRDAQSIVGCSPPDPAAFLVLHVSQEWLRVPQLRYQPGIPFSSTFGHQAAAPRSTIQWCVSSEPLMATSLAQTIRVGIVVETQIFLLNQMWRWGQSTNMGLHRDITHSTYHSQGWGQVMVLSWGCHKVWLLPLRLSEL